MREIDGKFNDESHTTRLRDVITSTPLEINTNHTSKLVDDSLPSEDK